MMDCTGLEKLLTERSLAELTPDERAAAEAHFAACDACRERWRPADQSQELHDAMKPQRPLDAVRDAVMAKLDGGPRPPAEDAAEPQEGRKTRRLAGFEIVARLGRGGMGTVLKARQIAMDRFVALKILPQRLAKDERFVQRFLREARSAARLRHPNIVQAHDAGVSEGYYYFAMEFVDGEGLDATLRREGPLGQERALALMKQVASALAAAHEEGIVHRDIKPSNIMLDKKGEVRVTDFGLAKRTEGDINVTADGHTLGSPGYVSPEMAKGGEADARSDLYSLGATFFHVLAGRPPFVGKNFSELIVKHVNEPPPPLAEAAPGVDPRLAGIIDRLLCKDPADRHPSANALLEALEALGPLRSAEAAARAEGRAMIMDAPTMPMSEGQRLQQRLAAEKLRREARGKRRLVVLGFAGVAVLAAVVAVIVAASKGRGRDLTKGQPRPDTSAGVVAPPMDLAEAQAAALFRDAESAADAKEWATAANHVARLDAGYASTKFCAAHADAIAALRERIRAATTPVPPKTSTVVAPPPPPPPPPPAPDERWVPLFGGKTLDGWQVLREGGFAKGGPVLVEEGRILLGSGNPRTGIAWRGDFPAEDYEIAVTARREAGSDSFCGLYFPVGDSVCTLSVGGYRGRWVGLANVDGRGATENGTGSQIAFVRGRWYRIRLRVTRASVQGWVDDRQAFDVPRAGHEFTPSLRDVPAKLALISWETAAGISEVKMRRLRPDGEPLPQGDWVELFNGKTLDGWWLGTEGLFAQHGQPTVADGRIVFQPAPGSTGIGWTRGVPKEPYELALEAMSLKPGKDVCNVVFPVGDSHCILAVGGWGGKLVGLSMCDGKDANNNVTKRLMAFEADRWYAVRLRVTREKVEAWIDDAPVLDLPREGHDLTLPHGGYGCLKPLGLCVSQNAHAAVRNIRLRRVGPGGGEEPRPGEWVALFEGKNRSMDGWKVADANAFENHGKVEMRGFDLVLGKGEQPSATGIIWGGEFPEADYEVQLSAKCAAQGLNFCNVTFPVGAASATLVMVAGEPGCVGLQMVDGTEAKENVTTRRMTLRRGQWYRVRLVVSEARVEVWVDDQRAIDLPTAGHKLETAGAWAFLKPFGIASWHTETSLSYVRLRRLKPSAAAEWATLFDGKSLDGWKVLEEGGFANHGQVHVRDGFLRMDIGRGARFSTGIEYTGRMPSDNYEVEVEAMRSGGNLDFANLVFPLGKEHCALIVGGHIHGNLLGFRSIDGREPWDPPNQHKWFPFKRDTWYRIRLRVEPEALTVWVDDEEQFAMPRAGHRFNISGGPLEKPTFAVSAYTSASTIRSIRLRRLGAGVAAPPPPPPEKAPPEDPEAQARAAAMAAYARESDKVWALLKERKYAEAEKLIAALAQAADYKLAAGHVKADAEAVKLVAELWAAVEKGMAARKGKSIALLGAAGTLVGVKDGVVTIKGPRGEEQRHIHKLTARQAVAYAELGEDARAQLAAAAFLLAEQEDLDRAKEALDAAGDAPGVQLYKRRLAALLGDADRGERDKVEADAREREAAARKAWDEFAEPPHTLLSAERARRLLAQLEAFDKRFGATEFAKTIAPDEAALRDRAQLLADGWTPLFDGKSLRGWKVLEEGLFAKHGPVAAENGAIALGQPRPGLVWTGPQPAASYEVLLDAQRPEGRGGLCAVAFPVGDSHCLLHVGAFTGNQFVGLTFLDGKDASQHPASKRMAFEAGRWYRIRLRVTPAKVEAWVDEQQVVDQPRAGHAFKLPMGDDQMLKPFGITGGGCLLRNPMLRQLGR